MGGETISVQKINIGVVTLGCDKNRVDAELMLGVLPESKYSIVSDERQADVLIVNTCGFIESAKQESIETILELSQNKIGGKCKALIASGCLAERYSDELLSQIPELDAVVGVGNYMEIDSIINELLGGKSRVNKTRNINYNIDFKGKRILTTPYYTAYLKIAEGCNNNCSYCIIPKLRGKYRSRSLENVVDEAKQLAQGGTREVIIVAQDITKYGMDLYGRKMLSSLLREISKIDGIEWIRLLYCYPEDIDDELINEISTNDKICKYIDIPIQHIDDEILKSMRRVSNKDRIEKLIKDLRERVPGIVIRTTLIVGFPGETEEQFNKLYDFLSEFKLDRVGVFTYSQEEDTDAALYPVQIDEGVKKIRQRKLIALQKKISHNKNRERVGSITKVLIESITDNGTMIGRSYSDAPEIDGRVFIKESAGTLGEFVDVRITDAADYDLMGVIVDEPCK